MDGKPGGGKMLMDGLQKGMEGKGGAPKGMLMDHLKGTSGRRDVILPYGTVCPPS